MAVELFPACNLSNCAAMTLFLSKVFSGDKLMCDKTISLKAYISMYLMLETVFQFRVAIIHIDRVHFPLY